MIKLFANIGIGHENDWQSIKGRVVAAAQCNADALVITKSTPDVIIPKHKRYVAMESKGGELPYIEVANKSELDDFSVKKFNDWTKQIGIQKSLGAKNSFILYQFLFESIFLCLIGGILGLILVFLLTQFVSNFFDFSIDLTFENIALGLSVSAIIGIISGIAPALSASKLDPVEAIRR